jgi:predicted O-linked N-acetylglucosamine transferase (SPINDLY family)
MGADPRLALVLKYQHAGLNAEAWQAARDLVAYPQADIDVLQLGAALSLAAGAFTDTADICRRLLALAPDDLETWMMLGHALDLSGRPAEALTAYDEVLRRAPGHASAHNNRGAVLMGQGRFASAAASFEKSLIQDPGNVAALINFGVANVERGRVEQGLSRFDQALALDPGNADARDNRVFALHNILDDPKELLAQHKRFAIGTTQGKITRKPAGKIRIAYVSPDFRHHSVGFFVEALLKHHDRETFEVFCYANVAAPDATTTRFQTLADRWRNVRGLSTRDACGLIAADGIDVLVDLAGHTMGHRLDVFAARAAPVQVTALGYPGTTGFDCFDGRLADAMTDPADMPSSEPLIHIPGGMHCYVPPTDAPPVGPAPSVRNGFITFGSFNKLAKLSPATIKLWSDVLTAVPSSKLFLKTKPLAEPETAADLAARFAVHGIDAERLIMRGWDPNDRGHLSTYAEIDVALDPTPYNGTTTTCESLWMGVPVLTLAGRAHAGRVGASLLTSAGLNEWICATLGEFVSKARSLRLTDRAALRARISQSRLCDAVGYTRDVEAAYRALLA